MSIMKRLAKWLDPDTNAEIEQAKGEATRHRAASEELKAAANVAASERDDHARALDLAKSANAQLARRFAEQETAIAALRAAIKKATPYVADALDDATAELNRLGATSKKRPAVEAVVAAIRDDLSLLNAAASK